ncbi:MAG: ComF family protein [Bdellovibrionota bacterium]
MPNQIPFPFIHLLFAPTCLGCRRKLPPGKNAFCRGCVRFFLGAPSLKGALFEHSGPGKGFLRALRETAPERAAAWGLALLTRRGMLRAWRAQGVELVMHAPQSGRRGRSGLALLAESVARELGAIYVPHAFRKQGKRTQHGRTLADRMDTECFIELACPDLWVKGKQALVIDDVNTTGTTLDLCATILRTAGASRVQRFALAQQSADVCTEVRKPD